MALSLVKAIIAGLIAAIVSAALWAFITVATNYQIGFMAIGVGFLVGYAVRLAGQRPEPVFGIIGAIFALLGCVLGNLWSALGFIAKDIAKEETVSVITLITHFDYTLSFEVLSEIVSPMDFLFYAIAIYEGFKIGRHDGVAQPGEA